MSLRKGGYVIAGTPNITTGRHVGEIFYTSRLDTELNGAVEANGGVYAVAAFTGERSVPALLAEGKLPYVSMSEYESIVSANGSCRAFGWDGADATVFKVPKLNDVYLMAGTAASAGEFISESLPNITGSLYNTSTTHQDGAKVRPDSVRYRAMVQLATGVKEDATQLKEYQFNNPNFFGQSMWSDIAPNNASWLASNGQWNAKSVYPDYYDWLVGQMNAGVSGFVASTATYTDYDFVINTADQTFRLPLLNGEEDLLSNRSEDLTLQASGLHYTAPANGWFCIDTWTTETATAYYNLTNLTTRVSFLGVPDQGKPYQQKGNIPCGRGDDIVVAYNNLDLSRTTLSFVYAKGNGSLYYYVGDTVQDASLINAGAILGQLADVNGQLADVNGQLADVNGQLADVNASSRGYVVETYRNGTEWYRVYSDGWIEQWGRVNISRDSYATVTFLKPFSNSNYYANWISCNGVTIVGEGTRSADTLTTTTMRLFNGQDATMTANWYACGY